MTRYFFPFLVSALLCHSACTWDRSESNLTDRRVRETLSLNGVWEVEQGGNPDEPPAEFTHTVPVPSLLSAATPRFDEVGTDSNLREVYWYRNDFEVSQGQRRALLVVGKSKYGMKAWLNGHELGEHLGAYTAASFDVTDALESGAVNTLIVRLGAWRDAVPDWVPAAQDMEKKFWLPGIYDDVSLVLTGTPRIAWTKIEPDIDDMEVLVRTLVTNNGDGLVKATVESRASQWTTDRIASNPVTATVELEAGQSEIVEQVVPVPDARLWSPEDPFLYVMRTAVAIGEEVSDDITTRFGMRKVEWKAGPDHTGRFFLNNLPYYLRGSNITLHRFFEDTVADGNSLAWDRDWVRKLLSDYPKRMHWNTFRICVGRAPGFWYDLADELGLLLADEFMMWNIMEGQISNSWSVDQMEAEFREWIQESWNHPSIAWWDASNETLDDKPGEVIARVRGLDPTRQWENGGFNEPHAASDPIEDHPYVFMPWTWDGKTGLAELLDANDGRPPQGGFPGGDMATWDDPSHPYIVNEYGWLWINRDGTPTTMTKDVYKSLLGPGEHGADEYREAYAYLAGGLTEFWRSRRHLAGVLHFTYLGYSRPDGATSDNFTDVANLVLEPHWLDYGRNAFSPFGIYVDSWKEDYPVEEPVTIPVSVINDFQEARSGTLVVKLIDREGILLTESDPMKVEVAGNGKAAYTLDMNFPSVDSVLLVAELVPDDPSLDRVISRRKIGYAHPGIPGPELPTTSAL